MSWRPDPITEELHLSKRDLKELRKAALRKPVKSDRQAQEMFTKILQVAGRIGQNVLVSVLASLIDQWFPHLLPLWHRFLDYLEDPRRGLP